MWMGGVVPLGYDVVDRKLVVNEEEAVTVRKLFALYPQLGTVRRLKAKTDRLGIVTKTRQQPNGVEKGGKRFSRGNLYQLLRNPIYVGRIPHKGKTYPGQHAAIIDPDTWAAVQEQLARNASQRQRYTNLQSSSLLTGLVFDERGDRLSPTHTSKKGRLYRYYISQRLMHDAHRHHDGWRLPAAVLENVVRTCLKQLLKDRTRLIDALELIDQQSTELVQLIQNAKNLADQLNGDDAAHLRGVIEQLVRRIELDATTIVLRLEPKGLATALGMDPVRIGTEEITIKTPAQLRRRGVEARLIIDQDGPA